MRFGMLFGWIAAVAMLPAAQVFADDINQHLSPKATTWLVPVAKQTLLNNYMSSHDVYDLVTEQPEILLIDVRDPTEVLLNGHPAQIDAVVPIMVQGNTFNDELLEWDLVRNANFLADMDATLEREGKSKHDMIIITCGSGMRSAIATNALIEAGYTNVWHIPDGYEGDDAPGFNKQNAWRIAGLPWSHDLVPGLGKVRHFN